MDSIRKTALHESGHAVVGYLEGLRVESAALKTEAGTPGVLLSGPGMDVIELNLALACALLAGPLAVGLAEGYDPSFLSEPDSSEKDVQMAADCVAAAFKESLFLYDDTELDWERLSKKRIKMMLRQHWKTVEAMADALCSKPPYALTGEEAIEIIERAEGIKSY